jgi:hypothetical protein
MATGARRTDSQTGSQGFTTDVTRCCVVVEVAHYPQKDGCIEVRLDASRSGAREAAKPSNAKVAALHSSQDRDRLRPTLILAMEQELTEKGLP